MPNNCLPIEAFKQRPFSLNSNKHLAVYRAATLLKRGGLLAHHTATLPGIAALPDHKSAYMRLRRFKQRQAPFLLIADSPSTALRLTRFYTSALRRLIRNGWPASTTLLIPARHGLPSACYQKGLVAIRVDASPQTRKLARHCGGLLLSSSLNRKGGDPAKPGRVLQMRWHRWLNGRLKNHPGSGKASTLIRVRRNDYTIIRP